jgi:CRISPR-associated protein Cmr6
MNADHLRRAGAVVSGKDAKALTGQIRALGLVRGLEGADREVARRFVAQLGLGDDVTAAVQRLQRLPRSQRLAVDRDAIHLADAVRLRSGEDAVGRPVAPPPLVTGEDPSRTGLAGFPVGHVGLAATKLLEGAKAEERAQVLRRMLDGARPTAGYRAAYERWRDLTPPTTERAVAVVRCQDLVLCGLGSPSPTENGLALHPSWGTPWLPGTSLKGITRAWMRDRGAATEALQDWFGWAAESSEDEGAAGAIDVLDAWWVPEATLPWALEVVTPHHGPYYEGRGAPSGEADPVPNTFLAARGSFRVVVEGPEGWAAEGLGHLLTALAERGVGAKTRAGYGRMARAADDPRDREVLAQGEREAAAERHRLAEAAAAEAAEAASRAVEARDAACRARRAAMEPAARVLDVVSGEGQAALVSWFKGAGRVAILGLTDGDDDVRAAFRVLYRAQVKNLDQAPGRFGALARSEMQAMKAAHAAKGKK